MVKNQRLFTTETMHLTLVRGKEYWLWDETRGMNLAMRAKSEREAFIKAMEYYQRRLTEVETNYKGLNEKVEAFVSLFKPDDED